MFSLFLAVYVIKKTVKYLFYAVLGSIIGIFFLMLVVFNSSYAQKFITGKVTAFLSTQFKTKITIDRIRYFPFNGFALEEVYWGDQKNDTLFYVKQLRFNLGGFNAAEQKLTLNDVVVNEGYCKIITYPDGVFNMDIITKFGDPNDTIPDTTSPPFQLYFNRVACHQTRFRLVDSTSVFEPYGFDGLNEDFREIELLAKQFWIIEDSLHFDLRKLSAKERSGIQLKNLSAITTISSKGMLFDSMLLETPYSKVGHTFHMKFGSWDELADFNQRVDLYGDLKESNVDLRDLAPFASFFNGNEQQFRVNGIVSGPVNKLKLRNMDIAFGKNSLFKGEGSIRGLPDVDETFLDIKTTNTETNKTDLERLILIGLPQELNRLGQMVFSGRYTGFINDFVAYGTFSCALGNGSSDLNMKLGDSLTLPSYSGTLKLTQFDIGKLAGQPSLGKTSLVANLNGKGFSLDDIESTFKVDIAFMEAHQYAYQNIELGGSLQHKMFTGRLDMMDKNAEVHFDGRINMNKSTPEFAFKANIDYADLKALHFDTAHLVLSTDIDMNFAAKDLDHNQGSITLSNILFIKNGVDHVIDQIKLTSVQLGDQQKKLTLESDMLYAKLEGNFSFDQLPVVSQNILHRLAPAFVKEVPKVNMTTEDFRFECRIDDSKIFTELFFPDINIVNLNVKGGMNSAQNKLSVDGSIESFGYGSMKLNTLKISQQVSGGKGDLLITVEDILSKDTLLVKQLSVSSKLQNNILNTQIDIADTAGLLKTNMRLNSVFGIDVITTRFDSSSVVFRNKQFTIQPQSEIVYNHLQQRFTLSNVGISNRREGLDINGYWQTSGLCNLSAQLKHVSLNNVNLLVGSLPYELNGTANGKITFKYDREDIQLNTFLNLDELSLDQDTIGDFSITSNYDERQKRLLAFVKSIEGKLQNLEMGGYVDMSESPYPLNFNISFAESDLKSFQAFVKDEVKIFYGKIAAKCKLSGTIEKPVVDGGIQINQVLARIEYLKTMYGFNAKVQFDKDKIQILPFQLNDVNGKQAKVEGSIRHQWFSKFEFDLKMSELNGFQLLNTVSSDNSLFYGKAYATGRMALKGPLDNLLLEATLKSAKGTVFNVPLSDSEDEDGDELLNFVNKDTTLKSINIESRSALVGFGMNMIVSVNPDAEIRLVFDEVQDDKIIATGKGTLRMEMTKQGAFNMYGEMAIEDGEYKFTAVDVFTRKFTLKRGSTITWTGDPLQAKMNIDGIYKVRNTSVAEILTTATSSQRDAARQQRVPVECILKLQGNLLSPSIGFDLNFPDNTALIGNNATALETSVQRLRAEPELMQQQVVSLLLFSKFAPMQGTEQSAETSSINSSINNTLSDLISAQASNLLSKFIPGFDISADYQAAINQAQLTASRKFLNERLEVQTSVGMEVATRNSGNLSGQIMGQYDLNKDGSLKLRGFNKTAASALYNRNVTTQGMGLHYRTEFDSFSELLKRKSKKPPTANN